MSSPFEVTVHWVSRIFVSFVIIVIVLVAGNWAREQYRSYEGTNVEIGALQDADEQIKATVERSIADASARIDNLRGATGAKLDERLRVIDETIQRKSAQQQAGVPSLPKMLMHPRPDKLFEWGRLGIEIECLRQEKSYLEQLRPYVTSRDVLEALRRKHEEAFIRLKDNLDKQTAIRAAYPIASKIPGTDPYKQLQQLEQVEPALRKDNRNAHAVYQAQEQAVEEMRRTQREFSANREALVSLLVPIRASIERRQQELGGDVANIVTRVKAVLSSAAVVLVGLIAVPFAIRAFFYYILAPMAARRPPICIAPEASGVIEGIGDSRGGAGSAAKVSATSLPLTVDPSSELLVHQGYLQSSSTSGRKRTKWLLDWAFPLSSLASGMVALTQVRADKPEVVVVSPTDDPLSEVAALSLPEGSSMVLQPRCLAGVLTPRGKPVRITRHWRIFSLHSWLTLQLRYLVFHGPATLVVKGCRGVRLETANFERRVNQAATLGFSANLAYATLRNETFAAYFLANQGLLDDSFAGDRGFYLYEEIPHVQSRRGVTGRNLEAVTDALLKVVGI